MYELIFNKVNLPTANRYLILLVTPQQTRRTEVSQQWTSEPIFRSIDLGEYVQPFELKICEAASDKKLKMIGGAKIEEKMLGDGDPLFDGQIKIEQQIQGNRICVGICNIRIARKVQFQEIISVVEPSGIQSESIIEDKREQQELFQEEQEDRSQQMRFEFHCGSDFYLGSSFSIEVRWGSTSFKSKSIKDRINPVWSQNVCLSGSGDKKILVRVCDDRNNVLENLPLEIKSLRVMFPYNIQLKFKEEFMGAIPTIFFTVVRESFPMYSIIQIPVRVSIRGLAQNSKNIFVMLSLRKEPCFPKFIEVDRSLITSLEQLNHKITGQGQGQQDRIDLIGLPDAGVSKNMSVFKSYLSRKLFMHLFWMGQGKGGFKGGWAACKLIETKSDIQTVLKKVYYKGQGYTFKNYFQIFNPLNQLNPPREDQSDIERWKLMSNNYVLRNKLVNASSARIQHLKRAIQNKGKELVGLKKVLHEVKDINSTLVSKEKLLTVVKSKKVRLNVKEIGTTQLITSLISRQGQLDYQKKINSQIVIRMDSLAEVQQNQQELDKHLVINADELLKQQSRITKMGYMMKGITRQRQIIAQLEKVFEQRQVAFQINQALKDQSGKLQYIRQKKQQGLNKVYSMIHNHGKQGGSFAARVKRAQETLIGLNAQYARLISF